MKVICISGKAQHGKDTSANLLEAMLEDEGYKVLIAHYGDLVKYICKTFFDWNGEKDVYGRSLLQRIGIDVIRKQEPDYWVSFVAGILKFFDGEWDYVLIPDSRFPNEVDYLKGRRFDVIHMRVVRPGFVSPLTPEQQKHPSETALDNVIPDYYINNCGTLNNLRDTISGLIVEITGCRKEEYEETDCITAISMPKQTA